MADVMWVKDRREDVGAGKIVGRYVMVLRNFFVRL